MKKIIVTLVFSILFVQVVVAQFAIGNRSLTFSDPARSNSIPITVYYPALTAGTNATVAVGQFPVVVFGHGFAMSGDNYDNIWQALVPQGYVVAFVNSYTSLFGVNHGEYGLDLKYTAVAMQAQNTTASSPFFGKLTNKTALMGHSMGGGASILAAANNTQIATTITFAPADTDPSSISAAANTRVPSLVVVGSDDCVVTPASAPLPIYNAMGNIPKAYVSITGGNHCNFSDGSSFNCNFGEGTSGCANSIGTTIQTAANNVVLPWLNYWLKGSCAAISTFNTTAANTSIYNSYLQSRVTNPAGPDRSYCTGGNTQLQAWNGGSAYTWTPATGLSSATTAQPTASPAATTTYTLNFLNSNNCPTTDQVVVTVNPNPAAAINSSVAPVGSTVTICSGSATNFQASPSGSGFTYRWFKNGNFTGFTVPGGNVKKAGTYTVEVTRTSTGCLAMSPALTVVVNACKNDLDLDGIAIDDNALYLHSYPNPASQFVQVDYTTTSDAQLSITDLMGRTLIAPQSLSTHQHTVSVDVSSLAAGQYVLVLTNNTDQVVQRLSIY